MKVEYPKRKPRHEFKDLKIGDLFSNSDGQGLFVKTASSVCLILDPVGESKALNKGEFISYRVDWVVTPVTRIVVYTE